MLQTLLDELLLIINQ